MVAGRKPTVSDIEILVFFQKSDDPVLVTKEVADYFGLSTVGMVKRLKALRDEGYLGNKRPSNEHIWWLTNKGSECINNPKDT